MLQHLIYCVTLFLKMLKSSYLILLAWKRQEGTPHYIFCLWLLLVYKQKLIFSLKAAVLFLTNPLIGHGQLQFSRIKLMSHDHTGR